MQSAYLTAAFAIAVAITCMFTASTARAADRSFSVAPFLWGPALDGQLQEGPIVIPLDAKVSDLAKGIQSGAMLHAEASTKRLHASAQAIYLDFHDERFAPVLDANVRSRLFTMEALVGPRFTRGRAEISPEIGLRYTHIEGRFDAAGLGTLAVGKRWTEGLAGLEAQTAVTERTTLRARATYAFTGPSGQSSSDVIVAGVYRLSERWSIAGGYRWAKETVRPDEASAFGMSLRGKGPVLGLVFAR